MKERSKMPQTPREKSGGRACCIKAVQREKVYNQITNLYVRLQWKKSTSDSMEADLPACKANRAKIGHANTYRLEPRNKFRDYLVRDKAQTILTNRLQQAKYDGVSSPSLCALISEEILKAVKELNFDRYKYVVSVLIVEKADQAMNVASRWVWDAERDTWVSAKCETKTFIALALVMACYYE